ncbi:hypothetical protein J1605_000745 [Eschrichtius robustus]|uniref:Uncharacterized protein n=1 Tax=Eschrichtius robustus TaxID=9764 RepID=A0AB34GNF0_ESCRO|nr:hypothetical protein J1605_000745 [Eschrichtius robustus]
MIATEKTALLTVPKGERCTQGHMEKHLGAGGGQQYVGKSLCGFRGKEQARQGAVERLGRRRLLLVGYGIRVSALRFQVGPRSPARKGREPWRPTQVLRNPGVAPSCGRKSTVPELSYLDIIYDFAYIAGHSIGPSEHLHAPLSPRAWSRALRGEDGDLPAVLAVDGAVLGLTSVIVGFVFPSVQEVSGAYSFIIFARICLLTAVYIYVVIPETKGRTFMEIKRIFAQRNRVEFLEKKEEITDAGPHIPSLPARETSF